MKKFYIYEFEAGTFYLHIMTSVSRESPCKMVECSRAPLVLGGEAYGVYIRKYYYPMPRCSCPFVFTEPLTVCVPQQYWSVHDGKWWAIGGLGEAESLPLNFATFSSLVWCKPMLSGVCLCFHRLQLIRKHTWIHGGTISSDCPLCGIPEQTLIFLGTRKLE